MVVGPAVGPAVGPEVAGEAVGTNVSPAEVGTVVLGAEVGTVVLAAMMDPRMTPEYKRQRRVRVQTTAQGQCPGRQAGETSFCSK